MELSLDFGDTTTNSRCLHDQVEVGTWILVDKLIITPDSDANVGNLDKEAIYQLQAWLDRRVELDLDDLSQTNIAIGPHTMPRVRGTKSQYAEDSGLPKLSKKIKQKYLALRVLLEAAVEIAFDIPNKTLGVTQEDSDRLRSMLTALGKSDRV
mgnify:CR=1 FL=1